MNKTVAMACACLVALTMPLAIRDDYIIQLVNIGILNAIVVLGLNFVTGWRCQFSPWGPHFHFWREHCVRRPNGCRTAGWNGSSACAWSPSAYGEGIFC